MTQYITDFNKIVDNHTKEIRDIILDRDKYKCFNCHGEELDSKALEAHHKISRDYWYNIFLKFVNMDKYLVRGKHEEYLELMKFWTVNYINNLNNLITLCTDCHKSNMDDDVGRFTLKLIGENRKRNKSWDAGIGYLTKFEIKELKKNLTDLNSKLDEKEKEIGLLDSENKMLQQKVDRVKKFGNLIVSLFPILESEVQNIILNELRSQLENSKCENEDEDSREPSHKDIISVIDPIPITEFEIVHNNIKNVVQELVDQYIYNFLKKSEEFSMYYYRPAYDGYFILDKEGQEKFHVCAVGDKYKDFFSLVVIHNGTRPSWTYYNSEKKSWAKVDWENIDTIVDYSIEFISNYN